MSWLLAIVVAGLLAAACDNTMYECFECSCNARYCGGALRQPKDLTKPIHVLDNIEAAYNSRRIDWYNGVLDANFTFFPSAIDVNSGLPESWNRADEIDMHTKLFDKNYTALPCQSIFMDIRAEDGITWTESHPAEAPEETWYSATLYYDFKFEISPNTYLPKPGSEAVFTVRDAGKFGKFDHHWQLVGFIDLGGSSRALYLN